MNKLIVLVLIIIIIIVLFVDFNGSNQSSKSLQPGKTSDNSNKYVDMFSNLLNQRTSQPSQPSQSSQPSQLSQQFALPIPPINTIIELIKQDFLVTDYTFNPGLMPITTIFPNRFDDDFTNDYEQNIEQIVYKWNKIFPKYFDTNSILLKYVDLRPIFLKETTNDFILKSILRISYANQPYNLEVDFYGDKRRPDDLFDPYTVFHFYLIDVRISHPDNVYIPDAVMDRNINNNYESYADFTLIKDDPVNYAKYVEQLHRSENIKKKDIENSII